MLPKHFSPSSIACYIECPRAYFYKYIAKIAFTMDPIHLTFGSAVHAGIENHNDYQNIYEKEFKQEIVIPRKEELHTKYKQYFDILETLATKKEYDKFYKQVKAVEIPTKEKDYVLTYAKYRELYPIGKKILEKYFEKKDFYRKLFNIEEGQHEQWAKGTLVNPLTKETLPIPMNGRIDFLSNNKKIEEYKTSKDFYDEEDPAFKLQTKLYALWMYSQKETLCEGIYYYVFVKNLETLESPRAFQVIELQYSLEDLAEAFEYVKNVLSQIDQGLFSPGRCKPWCDHKKLDAFLLSDE